MATQTGSTHIFERPWEIYGYSEEFWNLVKTDPLSGKTALTGDDLKAAADYWGFRLEVDGKRTSAFLDHDGDVYTLAFQHDQEKGALRRASLVFSMRMMKGVLTGTDEAMKARLKPDLGVVA